MTFNRIYHWSISRVFMVLKLQTSSIECNFLLCTKWRRHFLFYGFQAHQSWVYSCNSRERPHPIFNTKCGSVKISYFRLCEGRQFFFTFSYSYKWFTGPRIFFLATALLSLYLWSRDVLKSSITFFS